MIKDIHLKHREQKILHIKMPLCRPVSKAKSVSLKTVCLPFNFSHMKAKGIDLRTFNNMTSSCRDMLMGDDIQPWEEEALACERMHRRRSAISGLTVDERDFLHEMRRVVAIKELKLYGLV